MRLNGVYCQRYNVEDVMGTSLRKSKGSRGPSTGIRLRLKSAIFCKSLAQEPHTNETTLIDILPGLNVQIQTQPGQEKGPFHLPLPLWVNVIFVVDNPPPEPCKETIDVELSLNDLALTLKQEISSSGKIELALQPVEPFTMLNIRIFTPNGIPLIAGLQTLRLIIKHNGHELGKLELPIMVKVIVNNKLG